MLCPCGAVDQSFSASDAPRMGAPISRFDQSTKAYGFWLYSAWLEILLNYRSTTIQSGPSMVER